MGTGAVARTTKGRRTRARIVQAAAELMYERGVVGTTLEDVKALADVSGSQLSHYFADKDGLVQAVIDWQADVVVQTQQSMDLGTVEGIRAWRDVVVNQADLAGCRGGCPLGALGGQLAEHDPRARGQIAAGFARWSTALRDGLHHLHTAERLKPGVNPDNLADTVLAALQGGLLLAQLHRDGRPLQTALDTILSLALADADQLAPLCRD